MRFVIHIHELLNTGLRVSLRRRKRDVTQKLLNRAEIGSVSQKMRGECVAERMRMKVPIHICKTRVSFDD